MARDKRRFKSAFRDISQGAKSAGRTTARSVKTAGETTVQGVKAAGDAAVQSSEVAKDAVSRRAESIGDAAKQGVRVAGDRIDAARQRVPWDSVLPEQIRDNLTDAIESSKTLSGSAKQKLIAQLGPALDSLSKDGVICQAQAFAIIQGLMANPQISRELNNWLQSLVKGSATIYDKAMDNVTPNAAQIWSNKHRQFDGGHTLWGAFQAARDASPNDSIFEEAAGLLQALARDATTPRGLPLVTWDPDTFNSLANTLKQAGISRDWLNDLVTYDAVELIASSIGILAVALNWNNDDVEEFSGLVSGMGLSAVVSANPLMLVVTVVALARAFHIARKTGDWKEFTDGLIKGGICTGAVLLVTSSSLVSGPAVVVLLTGICVGILANQATKRVSFVEIGQFVVIEISKTPLVLENTVASAKDVLPTST